MCNKTLLYKMGNSLVGICDSLTRCVFGRQFTGLESLNFLQNERILTAVNIFYPFNYPVIIKSLKAFNDFTRAFIIEIEIKISNSIN